MKTFFGLLLILASIVVGLYVGVWFCFVGGIVQIIAAVQLTPINALTVAWGVAKVIFSGVCGVISFVILFTPGMALLSSKK